MTNALVRQLHYNLADPKSFKCFDATLMPLPVEEILRIAQRTMEFSDVLGPDALVDTATMFEIAEVLYRWFDENLYFRDWKYEFNAMMFWDYDRLVIEVLAHKKYSMVSLVLAKEDIFSDEGFERSPGEYGGTARCLLMWLRRLLEAINERIDQWNIICKFSVPIFSEPLPRDIIVSNMLEAVWDKAVEEAIYNDYEERYEGETELEAFEYFIKELRYFDPYSLAEIWHTGWNTSGWGPKGDWETLVDIEVPDWSYYYYTMYSFYVSRRGCPLLFRVLSFETEGSDLFDVREADIHINDTIDAIEAAMINWNQTFTLGKTEYSSNNINVKRDPFFDTDRRPNHYTEKENLFYREVTREVTKPYTPYVQLKLPFGE